MEKEKNAEEGCCSGGSSCGRCGCSSKVVLALILLLLGGLIGYLMGTHCHMKGYVSCPMAMTPAPAK